MQKLKSELKLKLKSKSTSQFRKVYLPICIGVSTGYINIGSDGRWRAEMGFHRKVYNQLVDVSGSPKRPSAFSAAAPAFLINTGEEWDAGVALEMDLAFLVFPGEKDHHPAAPVMIAQKNPTLVGGARPDACSLAQFFRSCHHPHHRESLSEFFYPDSCDGPSPALFFPSKIVASPFNFSRLVSLDLSSAEIHTLPFDFGFYFPSLKRLFLQHNNLSTLPASICALSLLTTLRVEQNKLEFLPDSLHSLLRLRFLLCSGNLLTFLPSALFHSLSSLEYVDISDNPVTFLPPVLLPKNKIKIVSLRTPLLCSSDLQFLPPVLFDRGDEGSFETHLVHPADVGEPSRHDRRRPDVISSLVFSKIQNYFNVQSLQDRRLVEGKVPCNLISFMNGGREELLNSTWSFHSKEHPPVHDDSFWREARVAEDGGRLFSHVGGGPPPKCGKVERQMEGFFFKVPSLKEFASRAFFATLIVHDVPANFPFAIRAYWRTGHCCDCCGGVYFESWTPRFRMAMAPLETEAESSGSMGISLLKMCWPHWVDGKSKMEHLFSKTGKPYPSSHPFGSVLDYWIALIGPSVRIDKSLARRHFKRLLKSSRGEDDWHSFGYHRHQASGQHLLYCATFLYDRYLIFNCLCPPPSSSLTMFFASKAYIGHRFAVFQQLSKF